MRRNVHRPNQKDNLLDGHEKRRMNAWQLLIGHLEKFLSPSRHESDSVTARGHGRMERVGHGAEELFRCCAQALGDPLETIKKIVPWEDFRTDIEAVTETKPEERKSNAGRKPYDTIL